MPTKQKSGLYRARIKIGVDGDGKDVYKYISGKTKKELEHAREEAVRKYITGVSLNNDRLFGEYAQEWFRLRLMPKASPSSIESYRTALNKHILPLFGSRNLRAITPLEIQTFLDTFQGMSSSKITYIAATFRRIYESAMTDGLVRQNPTASIVKPSATPAKEKPALTPAQRAAIARVCETHEHGLYLALLFYLGVRPGEARGLQWGDIDWENHTVHVQRDIDYKANGAVGKLKNEKSNRFVPIPDPLYRILRDAREMPDLFIVRSERTGSAISKTASLRMWVALMVACNMAEPVPEQKQKRCREKRGRQSLDISDKWSPLFTPHTLRHNFITMCWEQDIDVFTTAKLVGHSDINTTQKVYTHLTERKRQQAVQRINKMFEEVPILANEGQNSDNVVKLP